MKTEPPEKSMKSCFLQGQNNTALNNMAPAVQYRRSHSFH